MFDHQHKAHLLPGGGLPLQKAWGVLDDLRLGHERTITPGKLQE